MTIEATRPPSPEPLEPRLSRAARGFRPSTLREIMELASRPGILSFALGMPADDLFPAEELAEAGRHALGDDPHCLQYGMPSEEIKGHIVSLMAQRSVRCRPQQILLTAGAQQGMDLLVRLLVDPGDSVVVEETIYEGIQLALRGRSADVLTVETDSAAGLDVAAFERILTRGVRPAFLYVITDGHNPLGGSIPSDKRRRLVELATRYGVPILEDDAYGLLYYDRIPARPLRALDDRWIFYIGSFSKILAPALRLGWVVLPEALVAKAAAFKHASDLDVSNLSQHTAARFLAGGKLPVHVARLRCEYKKRRDAMLETLTDEMPSGVSWNQPSSGMFVWLELPEGLDALDLLRAAVDEEQVAFSPGSAFAVGDAEQARRCLRLCFASRPVDEIVDGVERLARVIGRALG